MAAASSENDTEPSLALARSAQRLPHRSAHSKAQERRCIAFKVSLWKAIVYIVLVYSSCVRGSFFWNHFLLLF